MKMEENKEVFLNACLTREWNYFPSHFRKLIQFRVGHNKYNLRLDPRTHSCGRCLKSILVALLVAITVFSVSSIIPSYLEHFPEGNEFLMALMNIKKKQKVHGVHWSKEWGFNITGFYHDCFLQAKLLGSEKNRGWPQHALCILLCLYIVPCGYLVTVWRRSDNRRGEMSWALFNGRLLGSGGCVPNRFKKVLQ